MNYPFLTAKERDVETGLDYFLARYYSSQQGRFTSADELVSATSPIAYADTRNAQSLNKYHYVNNNPLITTDPDGHCPENQNCPVISNPPSLLSKDQIAAEVAADVAIGAGKAVANIGIGINNFSNFFLNGNDPAYAIEPFEASSKVQYIAQHATEVLTVVAPLLGGFGPANVVTASTRPTTAAAAETGNAAGRVSTLKPGPFATESIPASGPGRNWTAEQRAFAQSPGTCHTCGATVPGTRSGAWVLDHQPASKLNLDNAPQQLFKQCLHCSRVQGGEVRKALGPQNIPQGLIKRR